MAASSGPDSTLRTDGPKIRRTREELQDLILEAGREVLLSEGLGTGAEHLTFKRVLARVEETTGIRVTNASVIRRIWDNQEEFQLEVIRSVVNDQVEFRFQLTSRAFNEAIAMVDLGSLESRRASLGELIRVTCDEYIEAACTSAAAVELALSTYMSVNLHTSAGSPLAGPFRSMTERQTEQYTALYQAGLDLVGWRVKPGLNMADGAATVSVLAEGLLVRMMAEPGVLATIPQIRPLDGVTVEWSLLAIGMNQIVEFFAEPDPDWTP